MRKILVEGIYTKDGMYEKSLVNIVSEEMETADLLNPDYEVLEKILRFSEGAASRLGLKKSLDSLTGYSLVYFPVGSDLEEDLREIVFNYIYELKNKIARKTPIKKYTSRKAGGLTGQTMKKESYYEDEDEYDGLYGREDEGIMRDFINQTCDDVIGAVLKQNPELNLNGTYYYCNGNDGTEFDWDANQRICEIRVENEDVDFEFFVRKDGSVEGYVWKHDTNDIILRLQDINDEDLVVSEGSAREFAEVLQGMMDDQGLYDEPLFTLTNNVIRRY